MPKPNNKEELQQFSQKKFDDLNEFINALSEEQQHRTFPEGTMNRNIRDVLAHLHHWHLMFLDWYEIGMKGEKPTMPAAGYTWKDTPQLNQKIWENCQQTTLIAIRNAFEKSHQDVQNIITKHPEDELFEKKKFHWTGSTSLAAYLISATSSHYDWAMRVVRKAMLKMADRID
jgi:hypothetical protein